LAISLGALLIISLIWQYFTIKDFQVESDRINAKSEAILQYAVDQGLVFDKAFEDEFGEVPEPTEIEPIEVSVDDDPFTGNEDAQATIVVFDDFQCPFSAKMHESLATIRDEFSDGELRIVYRDLPLGGHSEAMAAAKAVAAAGKQDKSFEMADKIFANQADLSVDNYVGWAREIGLDISQFETDMTSDEAKAEIENDIAEAEEYGASGTPTVYLNGMVIGGYMPAEDLAEVVREELE